ncbi:gamma-glutamylcyclotransferase family protein [Acutalibacter muris]|uniref:gamma-glutamylcyclotransferase family protein n=1 Tax=Acutalibacter muris TaxID=1796620 RepID=UPI001C3EAD5E|nr:gamma-glutamylcyclotransferase family protein [Acutalibacter muris]
MTAKKYIAYGSNMNIEQMERRCPGARVAGKGWLKDHRLFFAGRSEAAVASIEPAEGHAVPVVLWEITPKDEQALDRYEGYPWFYGKQDLTVEVNGKPVSAMVYVMGPGFAYGAPSKPYLDCIREGYASAGFDTAVLDEAVEYSTAHQRQTYELPDEGKMSEQSML